MNRPERPHRRGNRLPGWDYRRPGPYAITICTEHRWHLFGHVSEGRMIPNAAGEMVMDAWEQMTETFPTVTFDAWVLMPNHFHAIVGPAGGGIRVDMLRRRNILQSMFICAEIFQIFQ